MKTYSHNKILIKFNHYNKKQLELKLAPMKQFLASIKYGSHF